VQAEAGRCDWYGVGRFMDRVLMAKMDGYLFILVMCGRCHYYWDLAITAETEALELSRHSKEAACQPTGEKAILYWLCFVTAICLP
jgi:hypothetical protein